MTNKEDFILAFKEVSNHGFNLVWVVVFGPTTVSNYICTTSKEALIPTSDEMINWWEILVLLVVKVNVRSEN